MEPLKRLSRELKYKGAIIDIYVDKETGVNYVCHAVGEGVGFTPLLDKDGKPNNDGLYEGVSSSSNFVDSFKNWAIDASRKPGDTGIVESTYGYHIMYYVKANELVWYETVKNDIFTTEVAAVTDDVILELTKNTDMNSAILNWATNQQNDLLAKQLRLDVATIDDDANILDDLGADSLDVVEMLMSIEDEFEIEIPDEKIESLKTVGQVVEYIQENM